MIEVGMGHQHRIQRRKLLDAKAGAAQTLENEKPGSEDGIDDHARSANLQKKR